MLRRLCARCRRRSVFRKESGKSVTQRKDHASDKWEHGLSVWNYSIFSGPDLSLEYIGKISCGRDRFTAFCQVAGISDDLRPELGDIAPAFFCAKDGD